MISVLTHVKIRCTGRERIRRVDDPLSLLLADADCHGLVGQLSSRAIELGVSTDALLDDLLEFLLNIPRDIDDLRLEAQMIRLFDLITLSAAPPDRAEQSFQQPSRKALRSFQRTRRPKWRTADGAGLVDRRGDYITMPQAGDGMEPASMVLQAHARPFNAYYRLVHGPLGTDDDRAAVAFQTKLLKDLRRNFYAKRAEKDGIAQELHRLTFNARADDGSLETTTIFALPKEIASAVEGWLRSYVDAYMPGGGALVEFEVEHPVGRGPYMRHWALVRRFLGGLDPAYEVDGVPVLDLLKVPEHLRRKPGRINCRRLNVSQSISEMHFAEAKRTQIPYLSAWADRAWPHLFTGWELLEHKDRQTELARRQEREDMLRRTYRGDGPIEKAALDAALALERASWPIHAHDRPRSWTGWWEIDSEES